MGFGKKITLLCRFRGILGDNSVNMDGTVIYSKYTELYSSLDMQVMKKKANLI